ncbi:MAG: sulfurtransferase complex subunit TusB [Arenicellales bacterium]|jgi:tRNA 2-thiouridine synthesizing protein B|nr:sulfurtransferase complex subunit TusB [Arenicellales bacterium]MDP6313501.1 sulfurtransferase complex subunit TusB [Arenicellales bacterium]MDP7120100.1 sulfurtransferase complex subunit TusB [Arenicellales bacterium]MDP7192862.1 sulfurtransferase complex subunit TusB [Arenicellales bacterium]MDP7490433.1 sulfurtransferase complex subunit TusB [Arenicellales bacterium]|tara:strand:- start:68 stop:370 length:303 start_codon:yes stop_codon:yes gene_type:complete
MLHTVNKSPFATNSLQTCLGLAKSGSTLLLIEDGVYGALVGTAAAEAVVQALQEMHVYALGPDLKSRGIEKEKLIEGIEVVGYDGFVALAVANDKVQNWL